MNKTVYIGFGSNLKGSKHCIKDQISSALEVISASFKIEIISVSSLYESKPIGFEDQPNFINAVIKARTYLCPFGLLKFLQNIERDHERERQITWGPRTLDLDILMYDNVKIETRNLSIPHPSMFKRAFVMFPLREIDPELSIFNSQNIGEILEKLQNQSIFKITEQSWWRI